jgi:hypothetical protein
MPGRRELSFKNLQEIMPDVDRLMDGGYTTVGNWTLGQMCNHLALAMRCTVEGFTVPVPWHVRNILGRIARWQILRTRSMGAGHQGPAALMPKSGLDDRAEVEALRATMKMYTAAPGPLRPHPFLGALSRPQWDEFHCIHSALHLSFALPKARS